MVTRHKWYLKFFSGDQCDCNECFELGSNGTCVDVSCEDWRYDQTELDCVDDRPKQLTAFLLSLFLSSTGAANFYIGRNDLGTYYYTATDFKKSQLKFKLYLHICTLNYDSL